MQEGKLTRSWTKASASLTLEWRLMGVVLGPLEAVRARAKAAGVGLTSGQ